MTEPSPATPPTTPPGAVPTLAWRSETQGGLPGALELLDQRRLPAESVALRCSRLEDVRDAIRTLAVRGAPAIGVAAAYGLVLGVQHLAAADRKAFAEALASAAALLRAARPTAANLAWAVQRAVAAAAHHGAAPAALAALFTEARRIHAEDEAACAAMARHALPLVHRGGSYLTHCNTGRLATAGIGTAFGVFVTAQARGLRPTVYVGEVRPLLQGARLTAFEMRERGIEGRLLPDAAAASLLRSGRIDAVFVGADRIAANGDVANKVGTYGLAEVARANGVPFHVVAPTSTIDLSLADGSLVPIEERSPDEVLNFAGNPVAPEGFPVANPAFDVTPAHLVSSIVTERGIASSPYAASLRAAARP